MNNISIRNSKFAKLGLFDFCEYVGNCKTKTILEIGSYVGDSTEIFCKNFKDVYSVDPWENGYDPLDSCSNKYEMSIIESQFDSNILQKYSNIKKYKMTSNEFRELNLDLKFDVIYIDGLHTYEGCKNDILLFNNMIKENGYIAGHDYSQKSFPGVVKAVNEFFGKPDKIFNDTSWIFKIK